jgi:iron complex outermembrane receptor protein
MSCLTANLCAAAATGISAALLICTPSNARAQALEDVVVSASRTEQRSFDASGSIQSVDRDSIQLRGPQINISEALAEIPGIHVANRNNFSQDLQISIRGFGSRAPFGVRGVRLLIDGIPQTLPDGQGQSSQFALTSAERIEVLKGPLSLLYGNAAGGVVQVFTRSAGDRPEFLAAAVLRVFQGGEEVSQIGYCRYPSDSIAPSLKQTELPCVF